MDFAALPFVGMMPSSCGQNPASRSARYFPEIVEILRGLSVDRFVVDGELTVEIEGRLSFDALQMRLHPAESRVRKLAKETPARLVLFDMLSTPTAPPCFIAR